jgi:hypothetical protein
MQRNKCRAKSSTATLTPRISDEWQLFILAAAVGSKCIAKRGETSRLVVSAGRAF